MLIYFLNTFIQLSVIKVFTFRIKTAELNNIVMGGRGGGFSKKASALHKCSNNFGKDWSTSLIGLVAYILILGFLILDIH